MSRWLNNLRSGRRDGFEAAWRHLYSRTLWVVRRRTRDYSESRIDAEQIATDVMFALVTASEAGRLSGIRNGNELWFWVANAALDAVAHETRKVRSIKRGGRSRRVDFETCPEPASGEPTGELSAILKEEYSRGLAVLNDGRLQCIAELHLNGVENLDIAKAVGLSGATIGRELRTIRNRWAELNERVNR